MPVVVAAAAAAAAVVLLLSAWPSLTSQRLFVLFPFLFLSSLPHCFVLYKICIPVHAVSISVSCLATDQSTTVSFQEGCCGEGKYIACGMCFLGLLILAGGPCQALMVHSWSSLVLSVVVSLRTLI